MGGRRMIGIFPGSKASSHLKLFGSSRPENSGGKEAALRMNEFREGGNTPYEESLKGVLLRLSCPKNARIPYVWFLPKQRYILTLFGGQRSRRKDELALLKR